MPSGGRRCRRGGRSRGRALPEGVIAGGWNYVVAAYGVTVVGLAAYGWSLWRRGAGQERDGD